jgi:hypothetical protein
MQQIGTQKSFSLARRLSAMPQLYGLWRSASPFCAPELVWRGSETFGPKRETKSSKNQIKKNQKK